MIMDRVQWRDWAAIRCVAGACELIVGVSAGPRILSLRRNGGENLLYLDTTNFRVGEWRLHGGHRFTVAPEGAESYAPDNAPCDVMLDDSELRVAAAWGVNGMQRTIVIRAALDGDGFDIEHVLSNDGSNSWNGALWAITCVPNELGIFAPISDSRIHFWPGTDESCFSVGIDSLRAQAVGAPSKAGWHSRDAWIASCQSDATLVVHCPQPAPLEQCVDGGCNVEVFICPNYAELETLSGALTLAPGESASHLQRWRVLDRFPALPDRWLIAEQVGSNPKSVMAANHAR